MKLGSGSFASTLNIAASLGALAVGVSVMSRGGSGGADAIAAGVPLLMLGEGLKILVGLCIANQVRAVFIIVAVPLPLLIGLTAALLMIAAGLLGFGVLLWPGFRGLAGYINPLALGGGVISGLWALSIIVASRKAPVFPVWLQAVGCFLPFPPLLSLIFPAAVIGTFLGGLVWNLGLGIELARRRL